jgi:hypothetical protein
MMRVVVCGYLMIMQLAGPLACCCAATRVATPVSASATADDSEPAPVHCCCQDCQPVKDAPNEPSDKPPSPEQPRCPCQQAPLRAAIALSSDSGKQLQRELSSEPVAILSFLPADPHLNPGMACTAPTGCVLPFLTTADLLHVLHILRC